VLLGLVCILLAHGAVQAQVKVVACLGDSTTYGWPLPRSQAYPAQMEQILNDSEGQWKVHNFGEGWNTVLRESDHPYSTERALVVNPDIVIFTFGGNATREVNRGRIDTNYVADYVDLISEFSQLNPVPEMWICLPLALHSTFSTASPDILENSVLPYIHDVAAITGLPIIDLYSVFKDAQELYQDDDAHPTSAGCALMAEIVSDAILNGSGLHWPPDFNSDSNVDIDDLIILIEHWGQTESSLDLAPSPIGDGIVDAQDLDVLMEYWGQDVIDPTLIAHWTFDEAEGDVAYDNATESDAVVLGGATWWPDGGQLAGALQLDGVDDYIETPVALNPAYSTFSVFAWIKGGAPGQAIISQADGVNWLMADIEEGFLRTDVTKQPTATRGRTETELSLISSFMVTDDTWRRVGLVRDSSDRILYVDDVEVVRDTVDKLDRASGSLYLGAGSNLEPDSFWSGMIDDVRVYNRVVTP